MVSRVNASPMQDRRRRVVRQVSTTLLRRGAGPKAAMRSFYDACVRPLVVVPILVMLTIASLALLPAGDFSPGLLHWDERNGTIHRIYVCPRATICSEGPAQLVLIGIARLSGYSLYVALGLAMLSKCYCALHWLRNTPTSEFFPLQWTHELHRLVGMIFFCGSLVHTAAHFARWTLRGGALECLRMLRFSAAISGVVATVLLVVAVLPMWRPQWFKRCKLSFEQRHWLHLLCVPMGFVLCWHHSNIAYFCFALFGVWGMDRAYLFFVKTRRVEDVTFMRLGDGSVQMRWKNPKGVRFRAGEYVRIMVPSISHEVRRRALAEAR